MPSVNIRAIPSIALTVGLLALLCTVDITDVPSHLPACGVSAGFAAVVANPGVR